MYNHSVKRTSTGLNPQKCKIYLLDELTNRKIKIMLPATFTQSNIITALQRKGFLPFKPFKYRIKEFKNYPSSYPVCNLSLKDRDFLHIETRSVDTKLLRVTGAYKRFYDTYFIVFSWMENQKRYAKKVKCYGYETRYDILSKLQNKFGIGGKRHSLSMSPFSWPDVCNFADEKCVKMEYLCQLNPAQNSTLYLDFSSEK